MILYISTNTKNGKRYVGMTSGLLSKRIKDHKYMAGNGSNTAFHCAIRKYGIDSFVFEHIASSMTRPAMESAEKSLIVQENTRTPNGYNLTSGGDGFRGKHSEASIEKMKRSQRAARDSETDDQKKKRSMAISMAKKGKPQPWAAACGKKNKGTFRSNDFKRAVSDGMKSHIKTLPPGEMSRRSRLRKISAPAQYVAATRAQSELIEIVVPPKEDKK